MAHDTEILSMYFFHFMIPLLLHAYLPHSLSNPRRMFPVHYSLLAFLSSISNISVLIRFSCIFIHIGSIFCELLPYRCSRYCSVFTSVHNYRCDDNFLKSYLKFSVHGVSIYRFQFSQTSICSLRRF